MLGWHIGVYRQESGRESQAVFAATLGSRLAVWQTGLGGMDWLKELAEREQAFPLGGNGYPLRYTAKAPAVIEVITEGLPGARDTWVSDPGDVLGSKWEGKTTIDHEVCDECDPGEWLIVEAWDES